MIDLSNRHQSVQQVARYFSYQHLDGYTAVISAACHDLAEELIESLPDSPELVVGLRKLLEAKDCFVRASL